MSENKKIKQHGLELLEDKTLHLSVQISWQNQQFIIKDFFIIF